MKDEEYLTILRNEQPVGTITIRPLPDDVMEVDPVVLANMKARLSGNDHLHVYDRTDRTIDELAIQKEKQKLKRIFGSCYQIYDAFSSLNNINSTKQELELEKVDRKLLADYSFVKSREENVDELDFYASFLFGKDLVTKKVRILRHRELIRQQPVFQPIIDDYCGKHFDILKIGQEVIQMNPELTKLFKERKLVAMFDRFLAEFYGTEI